MNKAEQYALKMILEGAESRVEDDMDEDGEAGENHDASVAAAHEMIRVMRKYGGQFVWWTKGYTSKHD